MKYVKPGGGGGSTSVRVSSVSAYPSSVTLSVGEWFYGTYTVVCPSNATNKNVTWSSSNTNVATVNASSGYIYAKAAGTATIYATASDGSGKRDSIAVTVGSGCVLVNSIELNKIRVSLRRGGSYVLSATVSPSNATNKSVTWSSSNPSVASVSGGRVCAIANGSATITASANDGSGKSASCSVVVTGEILVTSVSLDPSCMTLTVGDSAYTHVTVYPADATNRCVLWTSNNTDVATVNYISGLVYAKSSGTAVICATSQDGSDVCGYCTVRVREPFPVSSVTVYPSVKTLDVGDTVRLNTIICPSYATNKSVTWTSSQPEVAKVSVHSGLVEALSGGETDIIATTVDGGYQSICKVTVNYCGGQNYRDVTQHTMKLQDDGYYVCSKCGYRVKSPALQDKEILSEEDFYKVQGCYLAVPYYITMEEESPKDERMKTNSILAVIDDIRCKSEYANQYEYADSEGICVREYTTENQNDWFYMPLSIRKADINRINILYYSGFLENLLNLGMGFLLPREVSYLFTAITLENAYDGLGAFLSDLSTKAGYPELAIIINLIALGASMDDAIEVGDIVVQINISVGAGIYVSQVVFTSDGVLKSVQHSIK